MDSNNDIYLKYMGILSRLFLKSYEEKGMVASGDWGRSLEVFSSNSSVGVKANYNSSIMMEKGRKAGSYSNIEALKNWIKNKQGLPQAFKDNPDKFAFIIARKHFLDGVKVPNEHNDGNVLSDPINEFTNKYLPQMWNELSSLYVQDMTLAFSSALVNLK
jgi:hypothetical protein|tara:strand:+ start:157 stop:636 length:480 start_codon:yes stop_codon:yes gene_type:complete